MSATYVAQAPKLTTSEGRSAYDKTHHARRPDPQRDLRIVPNAFGESCYFLMFTDDAMGVTCLFVLQSKTAKEFQCFHKSRNIFDQGDRCVNRSEPMEAANIANKWQRYAVKVETGIRHGKGHYTLQNRTASSNASTRQFTP